MLSETILTAWRNFCNNVLPADENWTVVYSEEISGRDAPRPQKPYLTLKIISGPRKVHEDDLRKNDDGTFEIVGQRAFTLSLQAYGPNCLDRLDDLSIALDDPDHFYQLKQDADIAVTNRGNVLDVSTKLATGYEKRGSLDIVFNSSKNKVTEIDRIEGVEISGEVNDEVKTVIETLQTITKE